MKNQNPIAEIIESSTKSLVVQCYELYQAPKLGTLIKTLDDPSIIGINLRSDEINERINSIYFGGGTPSLISENDTKKILNAINKKFHISEKAEVTMECNPDDINIKNIKGWKRNNWESNLF